LELKAGGKEASLPGIFFLMFFSSCGKENVKASLNARLKTTRLMGKEGRARKGKEKKGKKGKERERKGKRGNKEGCLSELKFCWFL